jgi:hypothetical protein
MSRHLIVTVWLLSGCGDVGKPFHYPADGALHFNQVQVLATHNSYHVETPGNTLPDWAYSEPPLDVQLDQEGVRSLELDLNWEGNSHFEVYHITAADELSNCKVFVDCLKTIWKWSARYPGHLPIYVQMEPKSGFRGLDPEAYFAALEREILSVWPREQILTPVDLQGTAPTLRDAVKSGGWPTLGALRGKIMFGFDNTDAVRAAYTHNLADLNGRMIFVDSRPGDPFAAVAIINDPIGGGADIQTALQANLLVRTMADASLMMLQAGNTTVRDAAIASGAHFVSTDYPVPTSDVAYSVTLPGGTPARCNPITAPADCTSLAVENPAFVGSGRTVVQ